MLRRLRKITSIITLTIMIFTPLTESNVSAFNLENPLFNIKLDNNTLPLSKTLNSQEIISILKKNSPNKMHPRLMATKEDFLRIREEIKTDPNMKKWFYNLTNETNKLLKAAPVKYELPDGVRLLSRSQIALKRIQSLAIMFQLTENDIYAKRAWLELETVSNDKKFPNWNPKHFLDTAEMSAAVAFGYDWLYEYLSQEQRDYLKSALIHKGLEPALKVYNDTAETSQISNFWLNSTNNWNTVCNSGIILAALAIADENIQTASLSSEILESALISITKSISAYGVDGSMPEGIAYWNYATVYMAYLLSSLDTALGTDFGLSNIPSLKETGKFPIYMEGTKGPFNLGDGSANIVSNAPQLIWFANKYNNPEISYTASKYYNPLNLIWYKVGLDKNQSNKSLPLDKHFFNPSVGIVTMRKSWDSNSIFVGIHSGDNNANHGDLDIGTFVIDAMEERWASELGPDNYNLPGYFNSQRWDYYRKRAEGQNTLVINPTSNPDQNINAKGTITSFSAKPFRSFTIIDMTQAYSPYASSIKRGLALDKNQAIVTLRDELKLNKPSEVYWFMHTQADIKLSKNRKAAVLTINNKKMNVRISSPKNSTFIVMDAAPLRTSPYIPTQDKNKGIKKLAIHLKNTKNVNISITFSPDSNGLGASKNGLENRALKDW